MKWGIICLYTAGIFIVTPYLPQLISFASSQFSESGVSRFVLIVEIILALLILSLAVRLLIQRTKKSPLFLFSIGGIFLLSFILYQFIPNPYELTHLPQYAILSMLIIRAVNKGKVRHRDLCKDTSRSNGGKKEENPKYGIIKNSYIFCALITGLIGAADEVYQHFLPNRFFTWYDIFLNTLGGILGLLIYWGIKKHESQIPKSQPLTVKS